MPIIVGILTFIRRINVITWGSNDMAIRKFGYKKCFIGLKMLKSMPVCSIKL